jgi:hypothetical protein
MRQVLVDHARRRRASVAVANTRFRSKRARSLLPIKPPKSYWRWKRP